MQNIPNNFYRVSIKALILDEQQRFLLVLEKNGLWEFPGGGLDFGEKPHDCLVREIKEEMGVEVASINKQPAYFITSLNINGQWWKSNVMYETKLKSLEIKPTDECIKAQFFTKEEAEKLNTYPIVKEFLKVFDPTFKN